MLLSINSLQGMKAEATDGEIGHVYDFFFDDETWGVRYVVIDTGTWLPSQKVLLAVESLQNPDVSKEALLIKHPKDHVEKSPEVDLAKPVTLDEELEVRRHYGAWPHWAPYLVGAGPHKLSSLRDKAAEALERSEHVPGYALHSAVELSQFHMTFKDGSEAKLEDLLMDSESWQIQQFVFARGLPGARKEHAVEREQLRDFDRETYTLIFDIALSDAPPVGELVAKR